MSDKLFGAGRRSRRQDRAHPLGAVPRRRACCSARASRRWGPTTTTRPSSRITTFQNQIQGGLQKYIAGHHRRERRIGRRHAARAGARSRRCCAIATTSVRKRRRRLQHPQPHRDRQRAAAGHAGADGAAGGHRHRVARRRRHRHHEHHARERDRADARDRRAHGRRREALAHPRAVPRRGGDPVDARRPDGRRHRLGDRARSSRRASVGPTRRAST